MAIQHNYQAIPVNVIDTADEETALLITKKGIYSYKEINRNKIKSYFYRIYLEEIIKKSNS
jgi:hypothetical protein